MKLTTDLHLVLKDSSNFISTVHFYDMCLVSGTTSDLSILHKTLNLINRIFVRLTQNYMLGCHKDTTTYLTISI